MDKTIKKQKFHYAWVVLICCCLLNASAIGLTNSNGLYYPQICEELGFTVSALSVHTIVCGITSSIAVLFVENFYKKYNVCLVIGISTVVFQLSYMVMACFHTILGFCIASVFTGISLAFLFYIPVPMLINNWFVKGKKTALSVCFVASGVSGILGSLLVGWIMTAYNWRVAYLVRGIVFLIVALPAFFLIRKTPEEMGLLPYGAEEGAQEAEKIYGQDDGSHTDREKRVKLVFAVFIAVTANLSCGLTVQLPNFATSIGLSIVMGSVLTSLAMVGNVSSKMLFGPLTEKIGITSTASLLLLFMCLGWAPVALGASAMPAVYCASVVTGFSACANTLIIPNLADTFAKGEEYVHVIARCSTGTMAAGIICTLLSSALYDLFGSFTPVFACYIVMIVLDILVLQTVFRDRRKGGKKKA